ncbi:hypothetical protein ACI3KW_09395 [Devosia sp. ZW T5_3]|uniref:hypothetical protein n=1 Tax=Devosia sp. ZW T5_3 TaxID=3378085 RepID=UPI0038523AFA
MRAVALGTMRHRALKRNLPLSTKGSGALGHQLSFVRKNCPRRHNPLFNSPICGQIQRLLEVRELEAFAERYISLLDVSAEMGVHPLRIKKLMKQNGVVPALTRPVIPATYLSKRSQQTPLEVKSASKTKGPAAGLLCYRDD